MEASISPVTRDRVRDLHAALDRAMADARADWPLDPVQMNPRGQHHENLYMLEAWHAVQAGRPLDHPALDRQDISLVLKGAQRQGIDYPAANQDLRMVRFFRQGAAA